MEPMETTAANQAATGAPGAIRIGGNLYLAAQPTKADFVALQSVLAKVWKERNAKPLTAVAQELRDMPEELRALVQGAAVARAVDRGTGNAAAESGDLANLLTDPECAAWWAFHLCRKANPDLTLAEVKAACADPGQVNDLLADLLTATSMRAADPNSTGATGSR
jgi:hypothetical protein